VCQAGAGSLKTGGPTDYSKVVQDVLESAIQQSLVNTLSAGSSTVGETSCVCHICSAVLKNQKRLRVHIRGTHLAIKSRRCGICGECFHWPMQVARHKKRVHSTTATSC